MGSYFISATHTSGKTKTPDDDLDLNIFKLSYLRTVTHVSTSIYLCMLCLEIDQCL